MRSSPTVSLRTAAAEPQGNTSPCTHDHATRRALYGSPSGSLRLAETHTTHQTRLRRFQQVKAAQSLIPLNHRSDSGEWQLCMYTREPPFYIPKRALAVNAPPVSTQLVCTHCCALVKRGAVWFLLWWLFLHRRLRPRQRGSSLWPERLCSPSADQFQRVLPVFIRALKKVSRLSLASLSASTRGVNSNFSPPAAALKRCVTAPSTDPRVGHDARKHRNRVWVIHVAG
jgi:hypothetical protein